MGGSALNCSLRMEAPDTHHRPGLIRAADRMVMSIRGGGPDGGMSGMGGFIFQVTDEECVIGSHLDYQGDYNWSW